jgi:phytoene synthase
MSRTLLDDCYDYCERLTKQKAGNFYYSFCGLPAPQYRAMCVLYAFMRVTDDCGDAENRTLPQRVADLDAWRQLLTESLRTDWSSDAMSGWPEPARLVLPAMRAVAERFAVPHEHLLAVVRGVQSDLEFEISNLNSQIPDLKSQPAAARFQTFEELANYCYLVAGAVGLCCIHIWGFHGDDAIPRAIDCGTAFQLTNILRDVGEDAAAGRVYLPAEDLQRFGVTVEDLVAKRCDDRFRALMAFEAERAKTAFYASAEKLLPCLEPHGRPILKAMLQLYGGLLQEIERRRFDVFRQHISLPRWRKLWIAADAIIHQRLLG